MKRIYTVLIILTCLFSCLFTCKPYEVEEAQAEYEYTNVVFSPDGSSVTIYLDGQVSVPRSLTTGIAKMGCDYFEVTFLYNPDNTPANYIIARVSWMAGKMDGISGIYRTNAGINYGNTSVAAPLGTLPAGQGAAILFAGKSDKTLMAIGRLSKVDDSTATPLLIKSDTKSVTFTLAAVTAAVSSTPASSSFVTAVKDTPLYQTADAGNTIISMKSVFATSTKTFPCFELVQGEDIKARYTFALSSGANANYAFSAYSGGIFISNPADFGGIIPGIPLPVGYIIEKKIPRFTSYSAVTGQPQDTYHESILMLDEKTTIRLDNNNTADAPFNPGVEFTFNTAGTINGTVFSLVFSIPVYALREFDGSGNRSRWYIRSSYGANLYDLDDGSQGMGGAVLLGTGIPERSSRDYTIRIADLPIKWQYSGSTTAARALNIDGLIVELITTDDNPVVIGKINYNDLSFRIDRYYKNAEWAANPAAGYEYTVPASAPRVPYSFPSDFYGIIEVIVEYHDSAAQKTYSASFFVLITNSTSAGAPGANFNNISLTNIVHLYDHSYINATAGKPAAGVKTEWDTFRGRGGAALTSYTTAAEKFRNALDNVIANTTTIFIVHHSFAFFDGGSPNINLGEGIPGMFMIIAADDDGIRDNNNNNQIILTRYTGITPNISDISRITHQLSGGGLNGYYFGAWPFRTPPSGITTVNFPAVTKTFTVDCRGVGFPDENTPLRHKLLIDNSGGVPGGGIYNVRVASGMNIIPTVTTTLTENGKTFDVLTYPLLH